MIDTSPTSLGNQLLQIFESLKTNQADCTIDHTPGDYTEKNFIEFAKKITRNYQNTLCGHIARGTFEKAKQLIETQDPKLKSLTGRLKNTQVNSLMIAIMVSNLDVIKWIFEHKDIIPSIINHKDHCGFSPLHWAYIVNNEKIKSYLKENNADLNQLNNWKAKPAEMASITSVFTKESTIPFSEKATNSIKDEPVEKILGSNICFSKDIFVPFDVLQQSWFSKKAINYVQEEFNNFLPEDLLNNKIIQDFYNNHPKLHLEKVPNAGICVVASQDIPKYTIVCTYGGELCPESRKQKGNESKYLLEEIDGDGLNHIRSYGSLICDSFPNCISFTKLEKGIFKVFIETLEDIKAGELLCINYHNHYIKNFDHSEKRYSAIKEWLNNYQPKIKNTQKKTSEVININDFNKLSYLIFTPSTFMALVLDGYYEKLKNCLLQIQSYKCVDIPPSINEIILNYSSFYKILSNHKNNSEKELVQNYLLQAARDRGGVNTVLNFIKNTVLKGYLLMTNIDKLKDFEKKIEDQIKLLAVLDDWGNVNNHV